MKKLLLVLSFLCGSVHAQSWTPEQKVLSGMFAAAWIADYSQTKNMVHRLDVNPMFNPFIGEHPSMGRVNGYFTLVPIAGFLLLDNISSENRSTVLKVVTTLEIVTVGRQYYVGAHLKF